MRRADLVVGMRLHALVLGLEHSRPVVACDPVDGGARVTSQAAALDRPLVVPVEELTAEALDAALARCLSGEPAERVHAAGERGRDGNARARAWFEEQLASQTPGRRRDRRSRTLGARTRARPPVSPPEEDR